MNGDDLRDARQGDEFVETARRHNLVNRVARDFLSRQGDQTTSPSVDAETILVQNTCGSNVSRFGILGIGDPINLPSTDLDAFQNRIALNGTSPTIDQPFFVVQDHIGTNDLGLALASGVTLALLDIQSSSDGFASCTAGVIDRLTTGATGRAEILWKPSGTGTNWGVIRFPYVPPPRSPYVDLSQTGGSAGGSSSTCSFTYTAKYPVGGTNIAGTNLSPKWNQRLTNVKYIAASNGAGLWSGTNFTLMQCDELMTQTNCAGS